MSRNYLLITKLMILACVGHHSAMGQLTMGSLGSVGPVSGAIGSPFMHLYPYAGSSPLLGGPLMSSILDQVIQRLAPGMAVYFGQLTDPLDALQYMGPILQTIQQAAIANYALNQYFQQSIDGGVMGSIRPIPYL